MTAIPSSSGQQRLIQIFLSPLDDVRVQIPRGDLVPALQHAGGIAERRHHVQQDHLRMKAARQPRGLVHDVPGSIREHNRNKNFLNAQHYTHLPTQHTPPAQMRAVNTWEMAAAW